MDDLLYYYWLSSTHGVGAKKIARIIEHFGSAEDAWHGSISEFLKIDGISKDITEAIIMRKNKDKLLKEIECIISKGISIITIQDEDYPAPLKEIYDPPCILYVKGKIKKEVRNIGIVGSRKCTQYGRMVARSLSRRLSEINIGIISGMALGIDTESHIGAIEEGGYTCAVLACGLDIVYPRENKKLMDQIEKSGAVISEYPPGTQPFPLNFPARNRIISGMSEAVIIVEAGEKSGALITADFALEQGRDVYAVPGSILSKMSKGTNKLIKEGAKPLTDICDILCDLGIEIKSHAYKCEAQLNTKEKMLMDIIEDNPIYIDELMRKASLKIGEVNSLLTALELKGIIKILPGKYIVRII